jgi:hypothetical protein
MYLNWIRLTQFRLARVSSTFTTRTSFTAISRATMFYLMGVETSRSVGSPESRAYEFR